MPSDGSQVKVADDYKDKLPPNFTSLAEGYAVVMSCEKAFSKACFGMLADKYGISWMLHFQPEG